MNPIPLRWCPSCDRFVRDLPEAHAQFHVGRTVDSSRTPEALDFWRRSVGNAA